MRGIPVTTAGRLTMAALVGMAITHVLTTIAIEGELPVFAIVFEAILLGLAALLTTRRWWAYALGAVVAGLLFLLTLTGSTNRLVDTSDPAFLSVAAFLGLALIAVVAGVWSAVQVRRESRAEA